MPKRKKPAATTRFVAEPTSTGYILDTTAVLKPIACSRYDRDKVLSLLNAGWEAVDARNRGEQRADEEASKLLRQLREYETCIGRVPPIIERVGGNTTPILREARASVALDGETQSADP